MCSTYTAGACDQSEAARQMGWTKEVNDGEAEQRQRARQQTKKYEGSPAGCDLQRRAARDYFHFCHCMILCCINLLWIERSGIWLNNCQQREANCQLIH